MHSGNNYLVSIFTLKLQFGPIVTEGNEAHVHHLVIYTCEGLNETHLGNGGDCEGNDVGNEIADCRGGTLIAAWAVGGEVSLPYTMHACVYVFMTL